MPDVTESPRGGPSKRWRAAQKAELASHRDAPTIVQLNEQIRKSSIDFLSQRTMLSEQELKELTILEIGGVIVDNAFDDPEIAPKIVIDPLFPYSRRIGQKDPSSHRVLGMGEYLPLWDHTIDLCWSRNTIDHTASPYAVLEEIHRVLKKTGVLVISCNLFPPMTRPLFPLFDKLDRPHPQHYTRASFGEMLSHCFVVQRIAAEAEAHQLSWHMNLKNNIAAAIVRHTYFQCVPK